MERLTAEQSHSELYTEFVELCRMADEGGFETIWTGEHHGMDFTITPNPFIVLADLASKTKNVRLGTGAIVAPFWHPIKLAGEAALADIVTGGRLEIGIARGAYSFEYERLSPGLNANSAGAALREIVPAIKKLWAGDYVHEGERWRFPKTTASPKPIQVPHPPIWIAAREEDSHVFAVRNGCNIQVTPLWQGDEEVERLIGRFKDACALHPEVLRPRVMLLRHTHVGSDAQEVEDGAVALSRFYCHFGAWFRNERPVSQGLIQRLDETEMAALEMFSPAEMLANNVVGTPDKVIRRIETYRAMGFDQYSYWLDNSMTFEAKWRSLRLFIDEVMSAFAS